MKKLLIGILLLFGILIIAAIAGLLRYDIKERNWYNESLNTSEKKHTDTTTIVCILATVHQPTANYNADSIVSILNSFQPDVVLTEEDTSIFESFHKRYEQTLQRPLFARLGRAFGFGQPEEIEGRAVRKYKIGHAAVEIHPFDFEGRNVFYQKNNTFANENEVGNKLEALAKNHSLSPEQEKIWIAYGRINDTLNQLSNQTLYIINQPAYYTLTETRQEYQYHKIAEIVNSSDSLKIYRNFYKANADFWDTRNKEMAAHIVHFIQLHPNKRIMVLTGSMHKYYLLKELKPMQHTFKFQLKEYYE